MSGTLQVNFRVFRLEKCISAGEAYLSVFCAPGVKTSILLGGKYGKLRDQWPTR
jgi:hypothetical protein